MISSIDYGMAHCTYQGFRNYKVLLSLKIVFTLATILIVVPDGMSRSVAFHPGLHGVSDIHVLGISSGL